MKVALLLVVVSVVTAALYLLRWHNRNSFAPSSKEDPASLSAAWASPPLCQRLVNTRKHAPGCFTATAALYPLLVTGLGGSGTHEVASRLRSSGVDVAHEELRPDGAVSWFYAVNDVLAGTDYPHHARLPAATRSFRSPRFARVYHLVRCPLPHISSFTAHLNASYDFVRRHLLLHISSAPAPPFDESSVWARRNYTRFFQDRVSAVQRAGRGCPRGGRCWLHFAALAWVFWNGHVQRYADALFRVEADLPALVRQAQEDVVGRRAGRPHAPTPSLLGGRPAAPRRPSVKHKAHREYGLSDVAALDAGLAHEVRLLAAALGYRHAGDPDPESATTDVPRFTCDEKGGT